MIAFWVFRSTPHGHERVMMAHEHDLIVKRVWWKGYREIELMSSSAVEWSSVLLRWNGKEYVAYREKSGSIR